MRKSASDLRQSVVSIEAVAFDCYGTVIDFGEPKFIQAMAEICDRQGLQADAADIWRRFLRVARALRAENTQRPLFRRYRRPGSSSSSGCSGSSGSGATRWTPPF